MAFAAALALLGTAACSTSGSSVQGDAGSPAVASGTVFESPTAHFNPRVDLEDQTFRHGTDNVLVTVKTQAPIITGVDSLQARKFSAAFESQLEDEMLFVAEKTETYLPDSHLEQYCDGFVEGKCVNPVRVKVTRAQIYNEYATVSYEFGMNILGGMPSAVAKSLTMDLRTGQMAHVGDFMEDPLEKVGAVAASGSCLSSFAELRGTLGTVDVFSPGPEGLYLSWDAGKFDATACGIAHATIPWEEGAGREQAQSTEAAADTGPSVNPCIGAPALPPGIDLRVCAAKVDNAIPLPEGQSGGALVLTPSGNIWCGFSTEELDCAMVDPYRRIGLGSSGKAAVPDRDDGPPAETPITLGYGEAATFGQFACVVQEVGMSCWNTKTQHGLFLSKSQTLMW